MTSMGNNIFYPRHQAIDYALFQLDDMAAIAHAKYGLPGEVRFCEACVMSNQKPNSCFEFEHTITTPKIAQLRIGYRGRGDLTDNMNGPLGHQIINKLSPF